MEFWANAHRTDDRGVQVGNRHGVLDRRAGQDVGGLAAVLALELVELEERRAIALDVERLEPGLCQEVVVELKMQGALAL